MHMCLACGRHIHTFVFQCNRGLLAHVTWTRNVCAFGWLESVCLMSGSFMLLIVRLSFLSLIGVSQIEHVWPCQLMQVKSKERHFNNESDAANYLEHSHTCYHACWYVLDVCCCVVVVGCSTTWGQLANVRRTGLPNGRALKRCHGCSAYEIGVRLAFEGLGCTQKIFAQHAGTGNWIEI